MVSKKQFVDGILRYMDSDIIPVLSTGGKWGLGTIIVLATERSNQLLDEVTNNALIKKLGVVDSSGMIDIDAFGCALIKSANKYGKLTIDVPFLGTFSFGENDIRKVVGFIKGGNEE